MVDEKQAKSPIDRAWDFLISLKLAITVLILLAAASIFGTIIEQNQPIEKYQQIYEDWLIRLFQATNMFDMYHAWWFLLLMVLFTVNLTCCTLDRLPRVLKIVKNPKKIFDEPFEKSLSLAGRWRKKGTVADWASRCSAALGASFGAAPVSTAEGEAVHLYAEKGMISRFGVYITHLSIIFIFVGAIIGNVMGYKGFLPLIVTDSAQFIPVRGGSELKDVGFKVRCNKFWVEYYKDQYGNPTGQPKEFASDLTVIENGKEIFTKKIVVNDPLRYKGVWYYQSSYGEDKPAAAMTIRKADGSAPPESFHLLFQRGEAHGFPGYGIVRILDFQDNLEGRGQAIQVQIDKPGQQPFQTWIFANEPEGDRKRGDAFYMTLKGVSNVTYTGLQVAHDPGVNIVWVGCALMVVGIMIAFFMAHQRVWVRITPAPEGKVDVAVGGATTRNRLAFEKVFEKIQGELKELQS
jgi:cytochrome c biogenesis protein